MRIYRDQRKIADRKRRGFTGEQYHDRKIRKRKDITLDALNKTKRVDYCDSTLNFMIGCLGGCPFCNAKVSHAYNYRSKMKDFRDIYYNSFLLDVNLKNEKDSLIIAVNTLSDTFGFWCPDEYIIKTLKFITKTPHHLFLILTKYTERMYLFWSKYDYLFPPNVIWGTSVEGDVNEAQGGIKDPASRIYHMEYFKSIGLKTCVVYEPMLSPLTKSPKVDLLIAGKSTRPHSQPVPLDWIPYHPNTFIRTNLAQYYGVTPGNKQQIWKIL